MKWVLTRRRLLGGALFAATCSTLGVRLERAAASDEMVDAYAGLDAKVGLRITGLGEAYLRRNPAERSLSRLAELIQNLHVKSFGAALHGGESAMQAALDKAYRRDFAAGRHVCVEGWVLSLTEARLHAYRHLAFT
jgi:hypothetical protein